MFLKNVCLRCLCAFIFFQGHVEGPMLGMSKKKGKTSRKDPCADDDVPRRTNASTSRGWVSKIFRSSASSLLVPYTAEDIKEFGNQLYREGKFEDALRCYEKTIRMNPEEPAYYRNRGLCLSKMMRPYDALADFEKSLELEPDSVRGNFFLGRQLFYLKKYQEAEEHLRKALAFGDEDNIMIDERNQIIEMIQTSLQKLKEIEDAKRKAREDELLRYLRNLIAEDTERNIATLVEIEGDKNYSETDVDLNRRIGHLESLREEYFEELAALFAESSEQPPSSPVQVPEYLCDKISYEIMKEPWTTPSGVTYERAQIMKHLETGRNDPMTRKPLRAEELRENKSLKAYIEDFLKKNKVTYNTSFEL